jgi:excisionase family DNA binding protein
MVRPAQFLSATVGPWASYVIVRDVGARLEEHARVLLASEGTRPMGEQLLQALAEMASAGEARMAAHRAAVSEPGSSEVPSPPAQQGCERPPGSGLTTGEVAEMLGITERQVTNLCQPGGPLSATKDRGRWRIDEVSVAEYLEGRG